MTDLKQKSPYKVTVLADGRIHVGYIYLTLDTYNRYVLREHNEVQDVLEMIRNNAYFFGLKFKDDDVNVSPEV